MSRMKLNHWFVKDNGLNISLMRYYVEIKVNQDLNCMLRVMDNDRREELFEFPSLEEAVIFTENSILDSNNLDEVKNKYSNLYLVVDDDRIIIPKKETINGEYDTILLTEQEVKDSIVRYYGQDNPNISAKKILKLENDKLDISFFVVEEFKQRRKTKIVETRLSELDLENVLNDFLDGTDYHVVNFKYVGGIRRAGYFVDEDTPYFEGIQVAIKGKEKVKK